MKKLPPGYPLHKIIATGGSPSEAKTTSGDVLRNKKPSTSKQPVKQPKRK